MKQLNEKLFKNTKLIKILKQKANVLDMILKQFPHVSNETASDYVTLNNTAKSPMEVSLTSQTSQETTTGKNLFNVFKNEFVGNGQTPSISINGVITSTSNFAIQRAKGMVVELESNKTYTLSFNVDSFTASTGTERAHVEGKVYNGNSIVGDLFTSTAFTSTGLKSITFTTPTIEEGQKIGIIFNGGWSSGATVSSSYSNVMIESGSEATSYEPFTNGPSPNPDYPQEIHRTTGENSVKVVEKNLFDENKILNATNWSLNSNGYYNGTFSNWNTAFNTNTEGFIKTTYFKENTRYTLSFKGYVSGGTASFRIKYDDDTFTNMLISNTSEQTKTITSDEGKNVVGLYGAYSSGGSNTLYIKDVQFEEGLTATPYKPYEETIYPISLSDKEMFNINNIADEFVYNEIDTTLKLNTWYLKKNIGKELVPVPLDYMMNLENNGYRLNVSVPKPIATYPALYCKYFKRGTNYQDVTNATGKTPNLIAINTSGIILCNISNYTSKQEYIDFFTNNNVYIYYPLATPVLEEITDTTLISQLRAIKNALSMQGTTHIISTATGENLPFLIKASAVKSFE